MSDRVRRPLEDFNPDQYLEFTMMMLGVGYVPSHDDDRTCTIWCYAGSLPPIKSIAPYTPKGYRKHQTWSDAIDIIMDMWRAEEITQGTYWTKEGGKE